MLIGESSSDSIIDHDDENMIDFKIKGQKRESLESLVSKDQMRQELLKVSGILLRIKTSLLLISCLSPNASECQLKPKSIQQVQAIYMTNNTPFI